MPRDYKHNCPCPHHPFECFGHPTTCKCADERKTSMLTKVVAQYSFYDDPDDGTYSISIKVNGQWVAPLGPFDTKAERQRVFDDMMAMMRSTGAIDLPAHPQ